MRGIHIHLHYNGLHSTSQCRSTTLTIPVLFSTVPNRGRTGLHLDVRDLPHHNPWQGNWVGFLLLLRGGNHLYHSVSVGLQELVSAPF